MVTGSVLLILVLTISESESFTCGPDGACSCHAYNQMDCSDTKLAIRTICDFIGNETRYNISTLHLERNAYKSINDYDFQGCYMLQELFLGGNNITTVEKESFTKLSCLDLLDVSYNQLDIYDETVQHKFLFPFTIKTLLLNGNLKAYASDHTTYPDLSYLTNLKVIHMDGLKYKMFPITYRKIVTLQTLILTGLNGICNISYVSNFTLQNLPSVRTLKMSSCDIENIDAGAFKSLANLENLDLSQNLRLGFRMLRNITYSLQFTKIKFFDYSRVYSTFGMGTQIKQGDICYLWNTNIKEMVLSKNRIQMIETNALILIPDTFKILRAEDNKFTFGPYLLQLGCMSSLEEFYGNYQNTAHNPMQYQSEPHGDLNNIIYDNVDCPFMENKILRNIGNQKNNCPYFENDTIEIDYFYPRFPEKLKRVEFARCDMEYKLIPFLYLPPNNHVDYLDFSGNILYSWIGPVGPFPEIKFLNFSRNYCSHIGSNFFDSVANVENLQLQENFIGLVLSDNNSGPAIFDKLVNVIFLNLSSNIISYLPPMIFSRMSKLETLDLSVNNIETWTINVKTLDALLHLKLQFNFFHTLPAVLRDKLDSNTQRLGKQFTIDLRNNSFSTNCDEAEYLRWMVKNSNNMIHFNDYIFRDKTGAIISAEDFISNVNKLDKECRSYTLFIVAGTIGISVFLAITVGGLIYKNRWKLRYLLRLTKIRHFGYSKLHNDQDARENFMYDAFISYANENLRFILHKIIPKLEEQDMKLCVHDRDFIPGNYIADNILDAIRNSKKTVVILSKEFLKSKWCLYEFNMARMETIYSREGANCLLIVMFDNVPSKHMNTEMLDWIKSNTYIEYTTDEEGEIIFWENLKDALKSE